MAMDLISVPTADLNPGRALIRGEITFSSSRIIEGVFNINPKLEVGGIIELDRKDKAELGVRAKTLLAEETATEPAISAGIKMKDLFFVLSKNLGYGFRGHLGLGNGNLNGVFLGFSKVLNPVSIQGKNYRSLPAMILMGEYIDEQVNLGVRFNLQENIKFDTALVNLNSIKLGLGYSF
jgi:hypothetical protein